MAKKTKNSNLSLEERLEQALIPNWDEPYKLPDNWCWLKLLSAFENCTDSKKKIQQKDYLESGLWSVVDQGQSLVGGYTNDETMLYNGNLPVIIFGDHTRCVKYIDFNFAQGADGVKVLRPKPFYLPKFFFYALQNVDIPNLGYRRHFPLFDKFSIPLAPLEEQQRIVEHVESLFAKLDEAKEKAQEVVDGFDTRKAAILHKAFSGELTAKWREKSGADIDNWDTKEIGDFSFVTKLAGFEYTKNIAPNLVDYGIPLFKGKNVQKGTLVLEFESFIPKSVSDELPRSKLTKKCLLTPYVGTIGNIALFDGSFEAHLGSNVGKIEIESDTFEEYLLYYIRSDYGYKELTKQKKATAQESISIQAIREVKVLLPTLAEQHEIVRVLDNLISKEQQIKETAEAVIEQIDKMKKAILARAFRGELGTNDPSEENAVELLKSVLSGGEN